MILVTGASGNVGREVVAQLLAAGHRVRALARDPAKARAAVRQDVEVVHGDLGEPATLDAALRGVERVFSLSTGPDLGVHEANLAAAARRAGSTRVVKLSVIGAGSGFDNAIVRWHEAGEKAFRESGLAWTFVRPGMFMSNALGWIPSIKAQGKVFLPQGQGKMAPVHPRDIASVSVAALTNEGHEGKSYSLTGGEALSAGEMVAVLSGVLGRSLEYVATTEDVARSGMLKAGMPAVVVDAFLQWTAGARHLIFAPRQSARACAPRADLDAQMGFEIVREEHPSRGAIRRHTQNLRVAPRLSQQRCRTPAFAWVVEPSHRLNIRQSKVRG